MDKFHFILCLLAAMSCGVFADDNYESGDLERVRVYRPMSRQPGYQYPLRQTNPTNYCNSWCSCNDNNREKAYCCPSGIADPAQCPPSITYRRRRWPIPCPGRGCRTNEPSAVVPSTRCSRRCTNQDVVHGCSSRIHTVLGTCGNTEYYPKRCCRPAAPIVTQQHLREAILDVVRRSYYSSKPEFVRDIANVIGQPESYRWDYYGVRRMNLPDVPTVTKDEVQPESEGPGDDSRTVDGMIDSEDYDEDYDDNVLVESRDVSERDF